MMWNILLHLHTGPFLSSYAQAQLYWFCASPSLYGGKHALWMHMTERLRNSCLYSCRNCNVQKMECLESVWTNCSSFLGSVKFKEQRTLRETIPAISPTRWKETHSMRGFFQNKLDFENVIPEHEVSLSSKYFFNEPYMFLAVCWEFF